MLSTNISRRGVIAATLAPAAIAGGCGSGTPVKLTSAQEQARIRLIESHTSLTDRQLAKICPGLYPRDFLTNTKKYPLTSKDKDKKQPQITAADRAQAQAAGCDLRPA
jgi:hypothetical protein